MELFELNPSLYVAGVPLCTKKPDQYTNATIIGIKHEPKNSVVKVMSDAGNILYFSTEQIGDIYGVPMQFIDAVINAGKEDAIKYFNGGTWQDKAKTIRDNWNKLVEGIE